MCGWGWHYSGLRSILSSPTVTKPGQLPIHPLFEAHTGTWLEVDWSKGGLVPLRPVILSLVIIIERDVQSIKSQELCISLRLDLDSIGRIQLRILIVDVVELIRVVRDRHWVHSDTSRGDILDQPGVVVSWLVRPGVGKTVRRASIGGLGLVPDGELDKPLLLRDVTLGGDQSHAGRVPTGVGIQESQRKTFGKEQN